MGLPIDSRPPVSPRSLDLLNERIESAASLLRDCAVCELRCRVNRLNGTAGPCGLGAQSHIYKQYVSLNEEPELAPAWRVFLGGCNFCCPYCDETPEASRPAGGWPINPEQWAAELTDVVRGGVKAVSLLGGEPSLHVHTILALAAASPTPLPLALNTNMYMTPAVLELLDGLVQWYLADFKFGNDACARRLAGVPRYTEIVQRNLKHAVTGSQVIIRHVLLPGHLECCFRPIADWAAHHLPGTRFQLYPGYVPCGVATGGYGLGRLNSPQEIRSAKEYLADLPLQADANPRKAPAASRREPASRGLAGITIGTDGRVYCHDLTPELASALATVCSNQREVSARPDSDHAGLRENE